MAEPEFHTLDDVEYGRVDRVAPSIRRVIAENPSKFTYRGTGTYLLGDGDVVVVDPGPALDSHRDALAAALAGERVCAILVTHCHADHSPLAAWLAAETGAPTFAHGPHPPPDPVLEPQDDLASDATPTDHADDRTADDGTADAADGPAPPLEESIDRDFVPDRTVVDGEVLEPAPGLAVTAVHTPGHTSNHVCWAVELDGERVLFSGDHVMGWSTTVVSPPDGDMAAYLASLRRVVERADDVIWPTHGPCRRDVGTYVSALLDHRHRREAAVLALVREGLVRVPDIVAALYADVRPELHKPAGRSVWAHLIHLVSQGRVEVEGSGLPRLDAVYRAV